MINLFLQNTTTTGQHSFAGFLRGQSKLSLMQLESP